MDQSKPYKRRSIRLPDYDYSTRGAYFVTICSNKGQCMFGNIVDGAPDLSPIGNVVENLWLAIPEHFPNTYLDEYVIMPNHIHGIIVLEESSYSGTESFGRPTKGALATVLRSFKAAVTKEVRSQINAHNDVWQRGYYEHVIRNDRALLEIQEYILTNALKWEFDDMHPTKIDKMVRTEGSQFEIHGS